MNRTAYSLLLYLLMPLILLRLLWRGVRAPHYWRRWGERFGLYRREGPKIQVWLHAVSVGEFIAAIPLVRALMETIPSPQILVTTTTPTGSARVLIELGDSVHHVYLPYDLPDAVGRFLKHFNPALAIVMETELWPNLFHACGQQKIPLLLANVRLSQRSMEGYQRWAGGLVNEALQQVDWAAVQSEADGKRLVSLGIDGSRVEVTGSIKFDLALPEKLGQQGDELRSLLGVDRPVWVAASTREGEEQQVIQAHQQVLEKFPNALLILVPRHPERFSSIAKEGRNAGLILIRRSEEEVCSEATQVYLGDTMGEMLLLYSAADVAYVGGSLVPTGSH
ncbi:MAG: 3-deoxy-D-manno-octulosonic acid transferase, partial [Gammaproteobacteria bacterium]|nr:3-deoxy-D-manno-octulosonic acid transferase [Gammaproteobacteria bacterium]